jgi:hypothetical protein
MYIPPPPPTTTTTTTTTINNNNQRTNHSRTQSFDEMVKHENEGAVAADYVPEPSSRVSAVNLTGPDYDRHPRLREARGYHLELNRGDVLYIPKFWFHEVRSSCRNIAVNFWWDLHNIRGSLARDRELFVRPAHEVVKVLNRKPPVCPEFIRELKKHGQRVHL